MSKYTYTGRTNLGKVVYFINGVSFENSKDKRDGKKKAEDYCKDNFLNPKDIIKFDSRTERDRYLYLLEEEKKGNVSNIQVHFQIRVLPTFKNANGDMIPELTYTSDFVYKQNGKTIIEDVKGSSYFINEEFITMKKVFDYLNKDKGLFIQIAVKNKEGWTSYRLGEKQAKNTSLKAKEEQLRTYKEKEKKEMAFNRKMQKEKQRYFELISKARLEKLKSQEKKRLDELKKRLTSYGIIL